MSYFRDRRGAANMAPVLMIIAFASMIGFLVWLGMTAEGTESAPMNEPEEEVDPLERGAVRVTEAQLQTPDALTGQTVRATGAVASQVGQEAFFLDYEAAPFLVKMDSVVLADREGPPTGNVVVVGTVYEMTDSIVTDWVESGTVGEGDRPLVEFATHFIEAAILRSDTGEEGEGEDGDGAGGEGSSGEGEQGS